VHNESEVLRDEGGRGLRIVGALQHEGDDRVGTLAKNAKLAKRKASNAATVQGKAKRPARLVFTSDWKPRTGEVTAAR
jgi:hypothetical protein